METAKPSIRLGTRASALARWQADWTNARLTELGTSVEIVLITTEGDVRTNPIGEIGGQGLFTKQIQQALLNDEIDIAVHSLKDLPTLPIPGLSLAAVPQRESTSDVLVCREAKSFVSLPNGALVGTGSERRRAQLLHARPELCVEGIRGNVDTRLKKLDNGDYDAIILAEAGLKRLGLADRITEVLPNSMMLPAIGQGALGIECRADDEATKQAVAPLNDVESHACVVAERTLLAALRAGCLAPVGALGHIDSGSLHLEAVVLNKDGTQRIFATSNGSIDDAVAIGQSAAEELLSQGAAEFIAESRSS